MRIGGGPHRPVPGPGLHAARHDPAPDTTTRRTLHVDGGRLGSFDVDVTGATPSASIEALADALDDLVEALDDVRHAVREAQRSIRSAAPPGELVPAPPA